jgi:hypothetical protein
MAGKSSWDQANIQQKLGLVWKNRKKISQIIEDYFYLPFFLLIILWLSHSNSETGIDYIDILEIPCIGRDTNIK